MKVVIVGGGTAGWLTACYFESYNKSYKMDNSMDLHYDVTLIESPNVPIIGAGEGSTAFFLDAIYLLKNIGVNEIDFLYETEATIKLAIKFKDWNGLNTSYISPIGPTTVNYADDIDIEMFAFKTQDRAHDATLLGYLSSRGYSTFRKNHIQNILKHAYHFDAHKVGEYLKKCCLTNGTSYIKGHINSINKTENGFIKNVTLETGESIEGDLFIDCSGFSRVLSKEMNMGWQSYAEYLPVNSALPYLHQYKENEQIMPETLAWAQKNGWMWQIPTQTRYGCGYVYCDSFVNTDSALQELEKTTGRKIQPIRNLKFEVGRLKEIWKNNVVSVGLSASFLEPLQATSIHTTIVQIQTLMRYLHPKKEIQKQTISQYNNSICKLIDEFKDLIQIHYLVNREDTDFWKFVKYDLKKTERTNFIIQTVQHRSLTHYDFETEYGFAGWAVWGWTLVGLDIISKDVAKNAIIQSGLHRHQQQLIDSMDKKNKKQIDTLLTNTELINSLQHKKFDSTSFNNFASAMYNLI